MASNRDCFCWYTARANEEGHRMDDKEFSALSPVEAYEYAVQEKPAERVRLLQLYQNANGFVAHPGAQPMPVDSVAAEADDIPTSLMLTIGRGGFIVSVIVMAVIVLAALVGSYSATGIVLLLLAASVVGLFALMWMMGALEMRLIEINQTLKRKMGADTR
jgi:hypothetical protein